MKVGRVKSCEGWRRQVEYEEEGNREVERI